MNKNKKRMQKNENEFNEGQELEECLHEMKQEEMEYSGLGPALYQLIKEDADPAAASRDGTSTPGYNTRAGKPVKAEELNIDPGSMFNQGFLAEVYKLRPLKDVVTRFPTRAQPLSSCESLLLEPVLSMSTEQSSVRT
ncbi:hypothetical protein HD806DRAFT_531555 [Xylariaceae sp. AK1471]|nr:hypothetical protein HD806DRAFT_531555 [Xylariaceae sp. AK1471]